MLGYSCLYIYLTFHIDAWVLLPDHLHCIWTLPEGDAVFSTRWRLIKREVTVSIGEKYFQESFQTERKKLKQQGTICQNRFWEHLIKDENDFSTYMYREDKETEVNLWQMFALLCQDTL